MIDHSNPSSLPGRVFSVVEACLSYLVPGILVVFMMFFITAEVMCRFVLNYSFVGLVDIVSLCVIMLAFLSLSGIQRENAHIAMDLIPIWLSRKRAGSILEFINLLVLMVALFPLVYAGADNVISLYKEQSATMTIYWPLWPIGLVIPVGSFLMFIRVGLQIWRRIRPSTSLET